MTLVDWVKEHGHGELARIARVTKLDYGTVYSAYRGLKRSDYDTRQAISDATGGVVSVSEVCPAKSSRKPPINLRSLNRKGGEARE